MSQCLTPHHTAVRYRRRCMCLAVLLLALSVMACDHDGAEEAEQACERAARTFQERELAANASPAVCPQDLVILTLEATGTHAGDVTAGDGGDEIFVRVLQAHHRTFCLERLAAPPFSATLRDAKGAQVLALEPDGCASADLQAGVHRLHVQHGSMGQADAPALRLYVRPQTPADSTTLTTSNTTLLSTDCPGCDFRGQNFAGQQLVCETTTYCAWCDLSIPECTSAGGNNFSGARFAGANLDGIQIINVNMRGASFFDDEFGPASMGLFNSSGAPSFDGSDLSSASFRNVDLHLVNYGYPWGPFDYANIAGTDLRGANLSGLSLYGKNLANALVDAQTNLIGTDLTGADLSGWDMRQVNFTVATLKQASLQGANFDGVDFTVPPLHGTVFASANENTSGFFAGVDLSRASFVGANLAGAHLEPNMQLAGADFGFANLQQAFLRGALLGTDTNNAANAASFDSAYMPGANLQDADLRRVSFNGAHLYGTGASVARALLGNTNFDDAIVSNLDFSGATLVGSSFAGAQMVNCNFSSADLSGANFKNARLEGAIFTGATMTNANLSNATVARQDANGVVLVYDGTQWTCQNWCNSAVPDGAWSFTDQDGLSYTVTFAATLLDTNNSTRCPNIAYKGPCTTVTSLTPGQPPFPPVPSCVPSPTEWCTAPEEP